MRSLTRIVLIFICLTITTIGITQSVTNETNIWYFGSNAGLDFNTSPPTPLLDGALSTLEGSATISDKFGNLLFYTDGINVWNKNHQVMPNGSGLLGHPSSAQSGIVIPKPGSDTFFYLITVPEDETDGMRYSEIDITLNGGLGDVVPATKNTIMFLNSSEKVTAVKHANKLFYWVVGRKKTGSASKTYVSFLIDCDGFHINNPIESNVGITNGENWGYLIANPKGDKLASASQLSGIEITDFDNLTGVVSNPIHLGTPNQNGVTTGSYGVSFSPDSKVLYATSIEDWSLFQWDMTAANIPSTQYYVGATAGSGNYNYKGGALQLASDGKIYMAQIGYNALGVINSPNTLGSGCDFQTSAISLGGRNSQLGLPPFVTEYFNHDSLIVYENHCLGEITEFDISGDGSTYLDSILWVFDDPASGVENTSTIQNPTHVFSGPGVYHVELIRYLSCIADTSYRTLTIYAPEFVDEDVVMCENGTYTLPDGTIVTEPGDYTSLISSWISGCDSTVYSHLTYPEVEFDAGEDHYICKGDSAQLNLSHFGNAYNYNWTPPASLNASHIKSPKAGPSVTTTYIVSALSQVDDNLVINGDFELGDDLFESEYVSVPTASNITPRGRYKVHSATPGNWPGNCGDHTSGSGNMLMAWGANSTGGVNTGANIWCQTVRTVPGLDYVFAAWIANIRSTGNSTSELALFINGNMVAQSNLGNNCEWNPINATYSAIGPNDTIVELCIAEIGGNSTSNYFAIDDISFFQTCTLEDTVTVFVSDPIFDNITVEHVNCFNGTDGSIDSEVSGEFEPYTFSWDSGQNTSYIDNLSAGDYHLTVTDSVLCVIDTLITITQPDELELTMSLDNIVWCDEVNTGGATVSITGGTPDYTILWDNLETTASATQLPDGDNNVTVTDANGCSATASITIDKQGTPDVTVSSDILTICQNEEATLTASGATTYTWSPATDLNTATGNVVIATPAVTTTYTVTGADDVGCENTAEITITVNELPSIGVLGDDICEGGSTAISATGANTYDWDNGLGNGASHTVSPTTTTTYSVIGTDGNGCENTNDITITVHLLPTITASADAEICENETTSISASGGITYEWDNALGEGEAFDVTPTQTTTYTVTGTDINGCENTDEVTITVNPLPVITINSSDLEVCIDESSTLTANGATTYTWSPATDLNTPTGDVVIATPSETTTYTVAGIDNKGCENTAEITITVNELPEIGVTGDDFCEGGSTVISATGANTYNWDNGLGNGASHTISPTSTTTYTVTGTDGNGCENTNDITITVHSLPTITASADAEICENETTTISASGGDTYEWDNALGAGETFDVSPTQTTTYTVIGTDINGCENTDDVTITVNPAPTLTVDAVNNEFCIGESTTITVSGTDNYSWSPATDLNTTTGDVVIATPSVTTTYTVTGTDNIGCENTADITLTVNQLPIIDVTGDDFCEGGSTVISATGANTYNWDNGLGNGASHTISPTSTTTYTVTGTDVNGCENTNDITITVHPLPSIVTSADAEICENETTTISASGGDTYEWDNALGAGETFDVTPTQTTTYTVIGTDINGCENTDDVTITVNSAPTLTVDAVDSDICIGESTTITVSGTDNYSWSPATDLNTTTGDVVIASPSTTTTYTVTGTDNIGCENTAEITITVNELPEIEVSGDDICETGSTVITATGANTYDWDNGLGNGASHTVSPTTTTTYSVTGTDGNGCENTNDITIAVHSLPTITASADAEICENETTSISAGGGLTYEWDNALGEGEAFDVTPTQTTTYTVIGTDMNGCTNTDEVTIDVNPTPTGSISGSAVVCQGDEKPEIIFEGINSSGDFNFTYSVNAGAPTTISSEGNNTATIIFPTDMPGEYNFTLIEVEDPATGCSTVYSDTITIIINPTPNATASGSITACVNDDSPNITFEGFNSSGEYTFTYNTGGPNEELTTNGTNTANVVIPTDTPGNYVYELVSVMDPETGCLNVLNEEYTVTISTTPTASITEDAIVCQGDEEPLVTITGQASSSNYEFIYTINDIEQTVTTPDGTDSEVITVSTDQSGTFVYTLTSVTDPATGCYTKYDDSVTVIVNKTPIATTGGSAVICEGDGTQVIYFSGTNSSDEYTFTYIHNGEEYTHTTEGTNTLEFPISSSIPGEYSYTLLTVTDPATGCSSTINSTETVVVGTTPIASFYPDPEEVSNINPTSQMVNTSEDGSYYEWDFGDGTPNSDQFSPFHDFPNQHSETYNIMLVAYSDEGCSDTAYRFVTYVEELIFYVPNSFTPDGDPYNNVFKPVFSSGYDKQDYVLYIYNRWGELVFESHDTDIGWDGTYRNKLCPDGTYVWKINVKNLREPESKTHVGHVTILR